MYLIQKNRCCKLIGLWFTGAQQVFYLVLFIKLMKYCVLPQIWETKKVCKSSDAVLKSELDVVFYNGEVMILAIYNQKHLQVSCISQYWSTFECYL